MTTRKQFAYLTPYFAMAPRVTPRLLRTLKAQGIRSVVSSGRQTDTALGDMISTKVDKLVRENGLEYLHIPLPEESFQAFEEAVRELPRPILALSARGSSSAKLWAAVMSDKTAGREVAAAMEQIGYDRTDMDLGQPGDTAPLAA